MFYSLNVWIFLLYVVIEIIIKYFYTYTKIVWTDIIKYSSYCSLAFYTWCFLLYYYTSFEFKARVALAAVEAISVSVSFSVGTKNIRHVQHKAYFLSRWYLLEYIWFALPSSRKLLLFE